MVSARFSCPLCIRISFRRERRDELSRPRRGERAGREETPETCLPPALGLSPCANGARQAVVLWVEMTIGRKEVRKVGVLRRRS